MTDQYYVYTHVDPETQQVLYVGMGKGSRAYATKTTKAGKNGYGHRSPEHSDYLDKLMDRGYLPHEWIDFFVRGLSRQRALEVEKHVIKELNPLFNRKAGLKNLMFSKEQIGYILEQKKLGRKQKDIAEEMNCSVMNISNICRGNFIRYKEMFD